MLDAGQEVGVVASSLPPLFPHEVRDEVRYRAVFGPLDREEVAMEPVAMLQENNHTS